SNGTDLGGGFIQVTADTLTVGGKLHANGGGGEVNLQACSLMLGPTGQTLATGPNGFNLLQASGPMEVQGTMTATVANTLDYLDPAHLPVVQSSHVSPPPVIVEDNPAVPLLCPGQSAPTSTTSTTSTTIAGATSTTVPTTTTLVVGTPTSPSPVASSTTTSARSSTTTTSTAARSSTTTTSTAVPSTSSMPVTAPPSSTVTASTTTTVTVPQTPTTTVPASPCSGEPSTLAAASCRIQMLADTVESAPPTILGGARTAHRLEALLKQVDLSLNSVEHGTKVKASLRKGRHALNSFET